MCLGKPHNSDQSVSPASKWINPLSSHPAGYSNQNLRGLVLQLSILVSASLPSFVSRSRFPSQVLLYPLAVFLLNRSSKAVFLRWKHRNSIPEGGTQAKCLILG